MFSIFKTSPCNRLRVAGARLERGLPPYTLLEFLNFDIDTLRNHRHYYNYEVFKQVVLCILVHILDLPELAVLRLLAN